ncbi:MAG: LysM peptidoglycan-binding domain-containing protein [Lachnospiraceae bacterium]|nr:LysM peptidoglycan-binding domain-containing protein [Lachnospiraceae bacterium]
MEKRDYAARAFDNRLRRQKQVRRNFIILAVFIVIVTAILFMSFSTQANDFEHQPSYKYYKSIEVSKGDTLWSIANDNIDSEHYKSTYDYISEVKKMNSLTSDNIVSGSYITIPYYSSEFVSSSEN